MPYWLLLNNLNNGTNINFMHNKLSTILQKDNSISAKNQHTSYRYVNIFLLLILITTLFFQF